MEARYVVVQKYTKELCRNFGAVAQRFASRKASFLFVMILFSLMSAVNFVLGSVVWGFFLVIWAMAFLFLMLFAPELNGMKIYRALSTTLCTDGLSVAFFDDRFEERSAVSAASYLYEAIVRIAETNTVYFLYTGKNMAILIDKRAFTKGDAESFSAFISQKTGKTVEKVKYRENTKNKCIMLGASLAALVLIIACVGVFRAYQNKQPRDFSIAEYSITLPGAFKEEYRVIEEDDLDLYLVSEDVRVYIYIDDLSYYEEEILLSDIRGYAEYWVQSYIEWEYSNVALSETQSGGYRLVRDSEFGRSCEYLLENDGEIWVTEFYCGFDDLEEYESLIEEWAKTIRFDGK